MAKKRKAGIAEKDNSVLIVIDMQERFRQIIFKWDYIVENINKLIKSFQILKVPIIVTEQYPKGLGSTIPEIKGNLLEDKPIEKVEFSCFNNKEFFKRIKSLKKRNITNIIICGIEAHVCVMNTLLDAVSEGFNVHLAVDAISSRKESDLAIAIERAKQAGAFLTTTEMIIFQLAKTSALESFREISSIVK